MIELSGAAWLVERDAELVIAEGDHVLPVTPRMIEAVFARYAKPLAAPAPQRGDDDQRVQVPLTSGGHAVLRAFSFRGWGDVLPTDYLLYEVAGAEPVCAPAPLVGAALLALARAAAPGYH